MTKRTYIKGYQHTVIVFDKNGNKKEEIFHYTTSTDILSIADMYFFKDEKLTIRHIISTNELLITHPSRPDTYIYVDLKLHTFD